MTHAFPISRTLGVLFVFFATAIGGPASAQDGEPMMLPVHEEPLTVMRGEEEIARFDIEVADDREERARGLMFRTDLRPSRAMLFVFQQEREASFWMANTPRSLDIIYASGEGKIITIAKDTEPFSRAPIPSGGPVLYVLEVNAGLSDKLGIETGDRLAHPLITGSAAD